jgi:glycosyltransferase involved in cell wall biosynthesis
MPDASPSLAVVVPFLNEEALLPAFLASIAAQTRPPDALVLVDDGSSDASFAIAQAFAAEHPYAQALTRPPRAATPDRLATASELRAFLDGVAAIPGGDWGVVAKLDADLSLPPDHFEAMTDALAREPQLGVVGAYLSMRLPDGRLVREPHPEQHVRGPNKFYRRACFEQVFPIPAILGWDTIDEIKARMLGWETRSIALAEDPIHLRPTGTHDGAMRGFARWGRCAWAVGDPLPAVLAGGAARMRRRPVVLGGFAYVGGWLRSAARRDPRADADVRRHFRGEQRARMRRGALAAARRVGPAVAQRT